MIREKARNRFTRNGQSLLVPFLFHYLVLLLGTIIPYYKDTSHVGMAFNESAHSWIQWDSLWYIHIASFGYENTIAAAYFPFVPFLFQLVHNEAVMFGITAVGFAASLYLLQEFFKRMKMNDWQITMGLLLYALNPASIYFATIYTEVWTVLFSLASLHMATKNKWGYAGLFAAMVTTTRGTALLFGIFPFVLFVYSAVKRQWNGVKQALFWGLSCFVGIGAYMVLLYFIFGDPFMFSSTQKENWHHYWTLPWTQFIDAFHRNLWTDFRESRQALWIVTFLFSYWGLVSVWKQRATIEWERIAVIVFTVGNVLMTLCFGTEDAPLFSTMRYLSVIFPIYGIMATSLSKPFQWLILFIFAALSFMGAWTFTHHAWFL
ncbi:hypothetical protein [Ectobacillus sp. sgz5001026]|uniref:hypothetical protein n=1 Tax=Ectobacillus sp. sgz5001026 TaxID=3242473 RepID=UPI0036D3DF28